MRVVHRPGNGRSATMHIKRRRGWELPESAATPEKVFLNRRKLMAAGGAAAVAAVAGGTIFMSDEAPAQQAPDPSAGLYPAQRNARFDPGRGITPEQTVTTYNNFYEFGT